MRAVFISYRRDDAAGEARALYKELVARVGEDLVFMDVDSIALGRDFREVLNERLKACDIMLALIGDEWLNSKSEAGNRRLDDPGDFVRQEIAAALERNISVTPVLLQGVQMPSADELPENLKSLAYRNGFELRHARWDSDVEEMIARLGLVADRGAGMSPTAQPEPAREDVAEHLAVPRPRQMRTLPLWAYAVALALAVAAGGWWYSEKGDPESELARNAETTDSGTSTASATDKARTTRTSAASATDKARTTVDKTIELVSDKTVSWKKGNGAYYSPNRKLFVQWKGERKTGKWSVREDGAICWHDVPLPDWDDTECESYIEARTDPHRPGNLLDSLK